MKKIIIYLLSSILVLSLTGCKNGSSTNTSIDNTSKYFVQDNLIQIEQLSWELSSDNAREVIGDVYEEYLHWTAGKIHLMPIKQTTFKDIELTSSMSCFYFDEQDQLVSAWYEFDCPDEEQIKKKMNELITYFQDNLPSSFEYSYDDQSTAEAIYKGGSLLPELFNIPTAKWIDEAESILKITIIPNDGAFALYISVGCNGSTVI